MYHSIKADKALTLLESSGEGLKAPQAAKRLKAHGENRLTEEKGDSIVKKFFLQLKDFSVIVLIIAAVVSFAAGRISGENGITDTLVIIGIVLLNAVIGVIEEHKAEKALDALKDMSAPQAEVRRDGRAVKVRASEVVPGDILILSAGDLVAADARLIRSDGLKADESSLTGESVPADKNAELILSDDTPVGDRKNCVFASSLVASGRGEAVVFATGMSTQIGKIAGMLHTAERESTPLQVKLQKLAKALGTGALVICGVIFIIGLLRRTPPLDSFMLAVSLAVAAIPEGLPAVVTIVLSLGVGKLSRRSAVVRHLPSIETLGSATVICSDKTGTLTENKMKLTDVWTAEHGARTPSAPESAEILQKAALCCDCEVSGTGKKPIVTGEPTEKAIIIALTPSPLVLNELHKLYPRTKELPFDSERKLMSTLHTFGSGSIQITKGAPDILMKLCKSYRIGQSVRPLTDSVRRTVTDANNAFAATGKRVLALAYRDAGDKAISESSLTFLALLAMEDPPRKESADAVSRCIGAGIKPVMITGDHALTAAAIAERLGISDGKAGQVLTGAEIERLSEAELKQKVNSCRVFARVTPEHKLRIIKAYKQNGETVAMTGDGVNDAPALKAADIGCAMGKSGTEVAKSAADMVLSDDNFATVVNAVEIGRGLYDNIKKAVHFLVSSNIGEIMLIFAACVLGFPAPMLPVQLLWLNLVTDSLPALALGAERAERDIMSRRPISRDSGIITRADAFDIAVEGLLFGGLSLLAFSIGNAFYSLEAGRTMAFCTLCFAELFHAFNIRTERSVFACSPFENPVLTAGSLMCILLQVITVTVPVLRKVFGTVQLDTRQWLTVSALCLLPLMLTEVEKAVRRFREKKQKPSVNLIKASGN